MDILEAIRERHSVREYLDTPLGGEALESLQRVVDAVAAESGLDIQLVLDNPEVFQVVARFGVIRGATASIALVARGTQDDEAIGYWGQLIVLRAQQMGLNTCWVALCSRKKSKARCAGGKEVRLVIAVGYGRTQGSPRKTKPFGELAKTECAEVPAWFATAVEAAQLAPTAMNNQRFLITLRQDAHTVRIDAPSGGLNAIDLGIVKRNFEEAAEMLGADWRWETSA